MVGPLICHWLLSFKETFFIRAQKMVWDSGFRSEIWLWLGQEWRGEISQVAWAQRDLQACGKQPLPLTSFLFVDEASRLTLIHHLDTPTLHCLLTWPSQSYSTMYPTSPPPVGGLGPRCGQRRSSCLQFCVCVCVCVCLCVCVFTSTGDTLHSV